MDVKTISIDAFTAIKEEITKGNVLSLYELDGDTKISADASSYGLRAVLQQRNKSTGEWKPVAFVSRSLIETERNYAQIKRKPWSLLRLVRSSPRMFWESFLIHTDHKPLISLLGSKQLDNLPPRILRFRLQLTRFQYSIEHTPGKTLYIPNTLSRAPLETAEGQIEETTIDGKYYSKLTSKSRQTR